MDDAALLLRIRVILVSTRAAARTVAGFDEQVNAVLERGRWLLDALEPAVVESGSSEVRERFDQARRELSELATA